MSPGRILASGENDASGSDHAGPCQFHPMISRRVLAWVLCSTIWLGGCINSYFTVPGDAIDEAAYTSIYPWYAEFCALSEIDKKPGFGAEIVPGGPGGHSILYLNGVCRVKDAGYPVVALCNDGGRPKPGEGVGLSVNDHYRNANWIATQGRDFVFRGDLPPGEALTKERYLQTQQQAEAMGILDGVVFHREVFDDQPAGMAKTAFMYDMSVATDYAVGFGRDRYCARVPLDRTKMAAIVELFEPGQRAVPVRAEGVPMERAGEQLHASGAQRARRGRGVVGMADRSPVADLGVRFPGAEE